ncbi:hypothetical protein BsWGS_16125 [Bradybaena similaris]
MVLSEMRASLRPPSKLTSRDKAKVVEAARTSMDSKMGEWLVNNQVRQDTSLGSKLGKLNREKRRAEITHQQTQEIFMKESRTLSLEPLILVERSPAEHDAFENEQAANHDSPKMPGYMRSLRTGRRTPSSLITIEAFTLETKKKRNIWEEVLNEKEAPRFKSSTMPAIRLSEEEVAQLQLGHMLHKPTKETITRKRFQASQRSRLDRVQPKPAECKLPEVKELSLPAETEQDTSSSVFITQLPQKGLNRYLLQQSSLAKTHTKS